MKSHPITSASTLPTYERVVWLKAPENGRYYLIWVPKR